ncbi:phage tail protein [Acutalibacter caecimuris]|uniref:phage tail protein n=1 Tax=Acutalibacter caecimuris TaxID=3093657 RepID=UPI002AC9C56B|nr:phage tail protein [Acutalibacter sp. M00118]
MALGFTFNNTHSGAMGVVFRSVDILVDTRYEVAENLKAYAKQILRESAEPYVSYEIGAIDLHRLTKDAFSRFRPGEIVRVIDDEDKINLRNAWHTVEILPDTMSRIVGAVFSQTFCNSRGGGDY